MDNDVSKATSAVNQADGVSRFCSGCNCGMLGFGKRSMMILCLVAAIVFILILILCIL